MKKVKKTHHQNCVQAQEKRSFTHDTMNLFFKLMLSKQL